MAATVAPGLRRLARPAISVAVVVAAFGFALPQVAPVRDVGHAVTHVGLRRGALLAVAAGWNLVTYWLVWMAALPGLGLTRAALLTEAPTALANTVPAGSYVAVGLTYSMLRSWGYRRPAATLAMLLTGLWNNFAKLAVPVLAVAALAVEGDADRSRVAAAAGGLGALAAALVAFAAAMRSEAAAARLGRLAAAAAAPLARLVRRPAPGGWDVALGRFRARTIDVLAARWHWLTFATVASHLSLYAVLLASLRATGIPAADVGWAEVLAVFAFARLVTAVPLTPGGLGVVELARTAGLVAGGGDRAPVVAAVLVYRALTYLVQVPLGGVAYLAWRRAAAPPHPDRR